MGTSNPKKGFSENIIQLLTIKALDMMLYRPDNTDIDRGENRPDNTDIDRGEASVNIGIIRSISHHVQCLNSMHRR